MKNLPTLCRQAALGLLAAVAAQAACAQQPPDIIPEPAGWYFRLGAAARFNTKATITGSLPTLNTGQYDDGFVLPDRGGTASAKTWNWGYNNSGQVQGNTLVLTRLDNLPGFGPQKIGIADPNLSGELIAGYEFADFEVGKRRTMRLNFEIGYGFSSAKENLSFAASGTAMQTIDTYGLGGVVPPLPPYAGTFNGPGPLIDLNPSGHVVNTGTDITTFNGSLDTTMHEFRIGASLSTDLTKRLTVSAGAGYSSIYADARVRYTETRTFPAASTVSTTLAHRAWLPGIYLEATANYSITDHIGVFLGADLHHNQSLNFSDPGHTVKLDLSLTYGLKGGVSFKF